MAGNNGFPGLRVYKAGKMSGTEFLIVPRELLRPQSVESKTYRHKGERG